ncbi:MAG: hypothetical protein DMG38_06580 [Acidobacteria bacterium]|nr:MAG: hypothetical protein DMG38_06580 [Acidobacteriota bacterium]
MLVSNVIFMNDRTSSDESRGLSLRNRRFCIRYPFAADAVVLDLETGSRTEGVTSDLSMGGIFVCTSKPLPSNTRVRVTLSRKDQKLEALGMVRIVKPRIGMGIEFLDLEQPHYGVLRRWVEQLSKSR